MGCGQGELGSSGLGAWGVMGEWEGWGAGGVRGGLGAGAVRESGKVWGQGELGRVGWVWGKRS